MNNEQVIKYVSENSKNPHAAMMVEQLLTGWDVEFQYPSGSWGIASTPNWSKGTKYRLVRKPAYRVYIDKDGDTFCARRSADGIISQAFKEVKWLSDYWIEYDPEAKKWPTPLVERIAAIDIKAAEWIVNNWTELEAGCYGGESFDIYSDKITHIFRWADTPQKLQYWDRISTELDE